MAREALISKCAINQILNNSKVYEEYGHIIRKAQTDKNAIDYYFTSHILEEVDACVKINGMEQFTIALLSDLLNFSKHTYSINGTLGVELNFDNQAMISFYPAEDFFQDEAWVKIFNEKNVSIDVLKDYTICMIVYSDLLNAKFNLNRVYEFAKKRDIWDKIYPFLGVPVYRQFKYNGKISRTKDILDVYNEITDPQRKYNFFCEHSSITHILLSDDRDIENNWFLLYGKTKEGIQSRTLDDFFNENQEKQLTNK